MTELGQIYRCNVCGNMVEVINAEGGTLVCCNQNMELLEPRQLEEGGVKHIPIIEKDGDKIKVKLGEVPHPMEEDHYIKFIELIDGSKRYHASLNPGDAPEAIFDINDDISKFKAIAYCNVHGLWPSD